MKLELKNIKIHEDMSEETTCFSASLYANGKKIAVCKNDGKGGCTDVYYIDYHSDLVGEVIDYCKKNPIVIWFGDSTLVLHNVEDRIDELLIEHRQRKMIRRDQKKGLVLHKKDSKDPDYVIHAALKLASPIDSYMQTETGRTYLKNVIIEYQKEGYEIMNTNINFNELGLWIG